jgi:hypothetical protein
VCKSKAVESLTASGPGARGALRGPLPEYAIPRSESLTARQQKAPISKSGSESKKALTAWRRSPEKRRIQAKGCRRGLTEPATTVLRGRKERTGSSGNVWRNWGYLAGIRQAQKDRWCQPIGRWRSERNSLAPQDGHRSEHANREFRRSRFLHGVNQLARR